jgi:hypothetical protein
MKAVTGTKVDKKNGNGSDMFQIYKRRVKYKVILFMV